MTIEFVGPNPWPRITAVSRTRGPRYAAFAYLGARAPELLHLKRGDVLVVNASPGAVRSHATSPEAMRRFIERDVEVYSSPSLHAKVIATSRFALVGSANASANSELLHEAVVVSDDPSTIDGIRRFVELIPDATRVDDSFLTQAEVQWDQGKSSWPFNRRTTDDTGLLPSPIGRFFLGKSDAITLSDPEHTALLKARRTSHRGPIEKYELGWYRTTIDDDLKLGDVLVDIAVDEGQRWIYPPAVVVFGPVKPKGSRSRVGYVYRSRRDLERILVSEARSRLSDTGLTRPRLDDPRRITSTGLQDALLGLWDLKADRHG